MVKKAATPATPSAEDIAAEKQAADAKARKEAEDAEVAATLKAHEASTRRPDMSDYLTDTERAAREETQRMLAAGHDPFGDDEPIVARQEEADEINAAEAAAAEAAAAAGEAEGGEAGEAAAGTEPGEQDEADEAATAAATTTTETTETRTPAEIAAAELEATEATAREQQEQAAAAATAAAAAQAGEPDIDVRPVLVGVVDQKKLTDAREALEAKVDEIEDKYVRNELTDEERNTQLKVARRELNAALMAEASNQAKLETNQQSRMSAQFAVYDKLKPIALKQGVDYAKDVKAQKAFDQALTLVLGDEDSAALSFGQQVFKAHGIVKAMLGVKTPTTTTTTTTTTTAKPGAAAAGKPAPRVPPKAPVTLRGVPAAAASNAGDAVELGGKLRGVDYEAWYARQPASVKRALLDS